MKQVHDWIEMGRRMLVCMVTVLLLASALPVAAEEPARLASTAVTADVLSTPQSGTYKDYLAQNAEADRPVDEISVRVETAQVIAGQIMHTDSVGDVLQLNDSDDAVTWTIEIPQDGLYRIALQYLVSGEGSKSAEVDLLIDGAFPFSECVGLSLGRIWENKNGSIAEDAAGNQLRPGQVQVLEFFWADFKNTTYDSDFLYFHLKKGTHSITIRQGGSEALQIAGLKVYNEKKAEAYDRVAAEYGDTNGLTHVLDLYEAELAPRKSDIVLYPTYDRSSPLTTPYDPVKMRMNTIGQGTWSKAGQWIEWDIHVKQSGYYKIGVRFRQDVMRGMMSSRRIEMDGELLCSELEEYKFPYSTAWQVTTLSAGDEEILFYLSEGTHTIRMEAVWGEIQYSIETLNQTLTELNTIYRKIVMITGSTPDTLRDYQIEVQIPELLSSFRHCAQAMLDEIDRIEKFSGSVGSDAAFLRRFAKQLHDFCENPDTIPSRLSSYKSNISTLSTLLISLQSQPLELDYLYIASPDTALPKANAGFFKGLVHELRMFFASFFSDYSMVGSSDEHKDPLKVWLTFGRDQANIVKNIIDDSFVPNHQIGVELSLVQGSVAEPVMAGKGPDVVIGIGRGLVADLAARDVVYPIDGFTDYKEICQRFQDTAMIPYMYNGHAYALPETQEYNMMFVRTDIYEELGLTIPETWEEIVNQIGVIQQNNLNIGMVNGIHSSVTSALNTGLPSILNALMLQNGLTFYNEELTGTVFSNNKAIEVYRQFTSFYTDLSCTVYFDAINQFRTGEMPLIIAPLSTYNSLFISAPEIKGLWTMLPIPGYAKTDETGKTVVDISEDATGAGTLIFKDCKQPKAAWEFLKFWSSSETQARFALELEMLLGTGGRYMTANTEAFYGLSWSDDELVSLRRQRDAVQEFPQLPGNYIITRNLTNAFVSIIEGNNARDTILKYALVMDSEIQRKQEEFQYCTGENYYVH